MTTIVDAAVDFSVTVGDAEMRGTLRGVDSELELTVDEPHLLGGSGTELARTVAAALAAQGIRLTVRADRRLVTLGVPRTGWLQRRITGSPHISVASIPAAVRLIGLRRAPRHAAPLLPPPTPMPLAPTFLRRRFHPSTTHDPDQGGYPRLVMAPPAHPLPGEQRPVWLLGELTTLGSSDSNDIRLDGLDLQHAAVEHTADDEFWLVQRGVLPTRVNGAVVTRALLRTGSRVELGPWTLTFAREEYADHGRPHGGRIGGELGHQRPQPPRGA